MTIGIGLLVDTLIVRSFVTPSVAPALGRWFWWPLNTFKIVNKGGRTAERGADTAPISQPRQRRGDRRIGKKLASARAERRPDCRRGGDSRAFCSHSG
jgi:hypothetical protein